MNEVQIAYYVVHGKGDASPWMPWSIDLTDEEMEIYKNAVENNIDLDDVRELDCVLDRAYDSVYAYEEECAKDWGDEFDDDWDIRVKFADPK